MFTPKNIQGALEELYDLCDPDYMVDMLVTYSEEFDDISPALLAKSFQKNAEMISEYRVLSSAGEGIDYQGKVLLNSRAVRLLSYVEDMSGDEKVRMIQSKELWLPITSVAKRPPSSMELVKIRPPRPTECCDSLRSEETEAVRVLEAIC